ncbi:MAG: dTMP kinase [Acidimicrobiia bacterium]
MSRSHPGCFVVLEGADGSGKSTQAAMLSKRLTEAGKDVVLTREPGGTGPGEMIRTMVLHSGTLDPRTEALLIAADRAEHTARVIRPALARGAVVVSDRHTPSSLAYQGVARGLGVDEIARLSEWATGGLSPDVVVVVDVPADVALARRGVPADRFEAEGDAFARVVGRAYRDLAAGYGWTVVDGSRPPDAVADEIWARVAPVAGAPA